VRIALENLGPSSFETIEKALSFYGPEFLGFCYDSGHGNKAEPGGQLDRLEALKGRLIALHLHDNDGGSDQHKPIFSGTVDWHRLAGIVAASGYTKGILTLELSIDASGLADEEAFLREARNTGVRFADMVAAPGAEAKGRL